MSTSSKSVHDFQPKGICVAPVTPFKSNGDIDCEKLKEYVEHLVESRASIVFVNGTQGESMTMTIDERKQMMSAWIKHGKGKLTIIHHIGAGNLRDSQELARYAEKIGAEAIACVGPTFYKPKTEELYVEYMKHVAAEAPNTPFYLYDIDFVTGIYLDLSKFFEMAKDRIPTLVGVKHTSTSLSSMNRVKMVDGGKYQVLLGTDETYIEALGIGIDVPVVNSYSCKTLIKIKEAFDKGDLETARKEQNKLIRIAAVRSKYGYDFPTMTKAIMKMNGINLGPPRLPMSTITPADYDSVHKDLTAIGFFDLTKP